MTPRERLRIELSEYGFSSDETLLAHGIAPSEVLDLASGLNAYGPPARVIEALTRARLSPEPDSLARAALAASLATQADRILLGHGAAALLAACGRAFAQRGSSVLSIMPGSSELARAARANGARTLQWRAVERTGHSVDPEQIGELAQLEEPALIALATPAAISGAPLSFTAVLALAARFPSCLFILDQAELALSEQSGEWQMAPADNVICVRSIGPELGLPAGRAGYVWARPELCATLAARGAVVTADQVVHALAEATTREADFIAESRQRLLSDRDRLARVLGELGLALTRSVVPGLLVRVTRAAEVAEELLLSHRISVRDCSRYGLPDHLRIDAVQVEDEARLRTALQTVLARRGLRAGREV